MQHVEESYIEIPLPSARKLLANVEFADDLNNSILLDIIFDSHGSCSFDTIRYELGGDYAPFEMFNLFKDIYNHRYDCLFSAKSVQAFITALYRAEKQYIKDNNKSFFHFIEQYNIISRQHKEKLDSFDDNVPYDSESMIETIVKSNRVHIYLLIDVSTLNYVIESFVKYFCQYFDMMSDSDSGMIVVHNNRSEEKVLFIDNINNQPIVCYHDNFIEFLTEYMSKKRLVKDNSPRDKYSFVAIKLPKTYTFEKILHYFNEYGNTTSQKLKNLLRNSSTFDIYESETSDIKSLPTCITDFLH